MGGRFEDEKADFNPKSWLSKYRRRSVGYLFEMLLFYHGIGIALLIGGSAAIEFAFPSHQEPSLPHSLSGVLTAGPIEESLFFGIPYYVVGSNYLLLLTGSFWAILHVFNSNSFDAAHLAFGNLLFVTPSLFFSLRTWATGRGWFAVIVHSAWNVIFFEAGCNSGEFSCTIFDPTIEATAGSIAASVGLTAATYVLYRLRNSRERQPLTTEST